MKILIVVATLLISLTSFSQDSEEYYKKAYSQIESNNYPAAIHYLDSALILNSKIDSCYGLRAFCFSALGEFEKGIENCNQAIELNPKNDFAFFIRGLCKSKLNIYENLKNDVFKDEYLNDTTIFKQLRKKYKIYWTSDNTYQVFDYGAAIEDYTKVIELNYKFADCYNKRAKLYEEMGEKEKAILDYNKSIELMPRRDDFYSDRALFYKANKETKKAIKDFNRAIKLEPNKPSYYENRGYTKYEQTNDKKGACKDLKKAQMMGSWVINMEKICE